MSKLERLKARIAAAREKGAAVAEQAKTDLETYAGAAVAGYVRGRYESEPGFGEFASDEDEYTIAKLDPEPLVAIPVKAIAYAGIAGKASETLQNVANGALAFYIGIRLHALGQEHASENAAASNGARARGRTRGAMTPGNPQGVPQAAGARG